MDLPEPRGGSIDDDHIAVRVHVNYKQGRTPYLGKMDTSRHTGISHAVPLTNCSSEAGVGNLTLRSTYM